MTANPGVRRIHKQQATYGASATTFHVTLEGHRTQRLATRRPKLPLSAVSAKGKGTSLWSAPQGYGATKSPDPRGRGSTRGRSERSQPRQTPF